MNGAGDRPDGDEIDGHEKELWLEWLRIIPDWANVKSRQSEHIRDLVRRGVPANLRPKIWKLLANAQQVTPQTSEQYKNMLKRTSECEKLIQRDISRTYPENDYFKDESGPGQEGLFNVIKAYSLQDEEVGYCQGSAFIVGLLLLQLSEEESFMVLCRVMDEYRMRELYKRTMAELGFCIYQLECLVQEQLPELYVHFQTQNFHTTVYSSSWFLTLFTSNLPLHLAYRVMDLFLSEGMDMIFRISVAILQICKEDLLKLDMEGLLKYFQKEMPFRIECDPQYLISCACQVKYDSKKMKKLYKDYTNIKTKEQKENIDFTRLRTDNRILQDKLDKLEKENKELADKLITGQVCRANEAEDIFVLKRELCQMRTSDQEQKDKITNLELRVAEMEQQLADRSIKYSEEAEMMIKALQEELVAVKLREAEYGPNIKLLDEKIVEQELYIKSLRDKTPENPVAQLQEELSLFKMKAADASCANEELMNKFNELQALWFEHLQQVHGLSPNGSSQPNSIEASNSVPTSSNLIPSSSANQSNSLNNNNSSKSTQQVSQPSSLTSTLTNSNALTKFFNNNVIKRASGSSSSSGNSNNGQLDDHQELLRVKQDLLTLKLHEAEYSTELNRLRSREMELEAKIKIQENKYKRKEEELKTMEEELRVEKQRYIEVNAQLKEEQRKLSDLEWQRKEEQILARAKGLEHIRLIGELKQKISSLEIRIEEINAAKKLAECGLEPRDALEFQERVAELQLESFRLDASNKKLHDMERKNSEREKE